MKKVMTKSQNDQIKSHNYNKRLKSKKTRATSHNHDMKYQNYESDYYKSKS